jgi:hypothetical protein
VSFLSSFWKRHGTENRSRGVQIINQIVRSHHSVQRSQTETARLGGDDIEIIDEYETRAGTVESFLKGWYYNVLYNVVLQVILGYVTHNRQ